MKKKTVLITGAAGGIGRATVEHFSQKDWTVIGIDRSPFPDPFPPDGLIIRGDVSSIEDWGNIIAELEEFTDHLDAVVNNAAVQITKPLLETTIAEWDQVMNTNLRSVFLCIKSVYPLLKAQNGGAVINVSSIHAIATSKDIASYAASKGGLLALTRAMAIEFARDAIRVNAILPGAVDTGMLRRGLNRDHAGEGSIEKRLENLANNTVNGKIGEPAEIAQAIYFLADEHQSSFITGQPLVVDGGASARLSTE